MEITWLGHSAFRIRTRDGFVVQDPYAGKALGIPSIARTTADIVTVSHDHPGHNNIDAVKGDPRIITGPGEYEIKGMFVFGTPTFHDAKRGAVHGTNTVYVLHAEDLRVCHLGDLGHSLTQTQAESIGPVDVLLVPVGGGRSLTAAQAVEIITTLEPSVVIPMHYQLEGEETKLDRLDKFFREMGVDDKDVTHQDIFKVTKKDLPEEGAQIVVLEPKR
jgi:L-ascorbate metabolism protein UlaG (beta-lactamase superfamily)